MSYRVRGRWVKASGSFVWSKKHRGVVVVGGGGIWRLVTDRSSDDRLVWRNVKSTTTNSIQIVYNRLK